MKPNSLILLFALLLLIPVQSANAHLPTLDAKKSRETVVVDRRSPIFSADDFVEIPKGCFFMGDTFREGYSNEYPVHEVCLSGFAIMRHEVTLAQWKRVFSNKNKLRVRNGNYPVTGVSRIKIWRFIQALNKKKGIIYRLPTEAEWEYACREGGKRKRFGNGRNIAVSTEINFNASPGFKRDYSLVGNGRNRLLPVGSFTPNSLGLYDMSGNAWEWVLDHYSIDSYSQHSLVNPKHLDSGIRRVFRDGREDNDPEGIRCAHRNNAVKSFTHRRLGFRLVRISMDNQWDSLP